MAKKLKITVIGLHDLETTFVWGWVGVGGDRKYFVVVVVVVVVSVR